MQQSTVVETVQEPLAKVFYGDPTGTNLCPDCGATCRLACSSDGGRSRGDGSALLQNASKHDV